MVVAWVRPEGWEGGEHQVHEAVDEGHVAGEDLDDGLGCQKPEGADERCAKHFGECLVRSLVFGLVTGISC